MTYKYKYLSTKHNMSIRSAPTTTASKIGQLNAGVFGYGDELFLLQNGDKWIKILEGGNKVGWVAVIHLGVVYGTLEEIGVTPPPVEPPAFPQSFTLIDPQGNKAEYIFSKVL